jgi:glutamate/tyrosine decarboxylase-like PLP-dependent enzyme
MKEKKLAKKLDLAKKEDLSIAVIHLINAEDHLAFTAMKTGKEEYLKILDSVRELRKKLFKKLIKNTEGEMWCTNKHLLAATMRLLETGEKCIGNDDKEANEMFKDAFDVYSLFWFLQKIGGKSVTKKSGK